MMFEEVIVLPLIMEIESCYDCPRLTVAILTVYGH